MAPTIRIFMFANAMPAASPQAISPAQAATHRRERLSRLDLPDHESLLSREQPATSAARAADPGRLDAASAASAPASHLSTLEQCRAELHRAEQDERTLERRLHRVHDPRGLTMLRNLRAKIATLRDRLGK